MSILTIIIIVLIVHTCARIITICGIMLLLLLHSSNVTFNIIGILLMLVYETCSVRFKGTRMHLLLLLCLDLLIKNISVNEGIIILS